MTHTMQNWRIDLINAHPRLFHPSAGAHTAQGYPDCADGWTDLLERACNRIEIALKDGGPFKVFQIKEEYGTPRLY